MYKLTTKNGSLFFTNIEELMIFVVNKINKFVNDESFIKISYVEDYEV